MTLRVCRYCEQEFRHSIYHPHQAVCSSSDCQRRRRADYHRERIAADPSYRALCTDSQTYWKEKNPNYAKQYRAKSKSRAGSAGAARASPLDDLLRFLRRAKNNSAKNNLAVTVSRSIIDVLWIATADAPREKNSIANAQVIVIQGDLKLRN